MRNRFFVATTLANDPHTEGLHNASKIAALGGVESYILPPSLDYTDFYNAIDKYKPHFIGLSYRQNEEVAIRELFKVVSYFATTGLIKETDDVKIQRVAQHQRRDGRPALHKDTFMMCQMMSRLALQSLD